jgi:SAM-dependent methyltransferase
MTNESWQGTDVYEAYMGRWSLPMAREFLVWFDVPTASHWLDVGCGPGALSTAVLELSESNTVLGIDPSLDFLNAARNRVSDPRARFEVGDARDLSVASDSYDAVVAGLVLSFVPDPSLAVAEMMRAARPGGMVGAYVWDIRGEMQLIRFFWEAAIATDAAAVKVDPRPHRHTCQPEQLVDLFRAAELRDVRSGAIDLPMTFRDFDDYWRPHTMPRPMLPQSYVVSLDDQRKAALREQLRVTLPTSVDGTINLIGRAWAVRGMKPTN